MLEKDTVKFHKKAFGLYLLDIPFMQSGEPIFVLFYFEMKRYCFGFVVNYLHNGGNQKNAPNHNVNTLY